jgi:hypothetical protein
MNTSPISQTFNELLFSELAFVIGKPEKSLVRNLARFLFKCYGVHASHSDLTVKVQHQVPEARVLVTIIGEWSQSTHSGFLSRTSGSTARTNSTWQSCTR